MLKTLGNLEKKRNPWEAVFFYFVYGSAGIFLCGVITSLLFSVSNVSIEAENSGVVLNFAPLLGGVYTFIVAVALIVYKNISKDAFAILCALLGTFASASMGMIFGFIPVAFLSAFSPVEAKEKQ